jgi:hypothetical protein
LRVVALGPAVRQHRAGALLGAADARHRDAEIGGPLLEPSLLCRGDREQQLVVVAPGEHELERVDLCPRREAAQRLRCREQASLEHETHSRSAGEPRGVHAEPVGDVDRGGGQPLPRQLRAERNAGHGIVEGVEQPALLLGRQPRDALAGEPQARGRLAGMARDVEDVARRSTRAGEGRPRRPSPERHRHHRLRRRREVAAHELRAEFARAGDGAPGDRKRIILALVRREADGEQEELGARPHRREVREIHGGRAPAEPLRVLAGEKVHAHDEQVRRRGKQARVAVDEGRVVSRSENGVAAGQERAELLDEPVFGLHARGAGSAFRGPGAVTGISRPGVSAGLASAVSGTVPASGSGGSRPMERTSSMLST